MKEVRPCVTCGEGFEARNAASKYCSTGCAREAANAQRRLDKQPNRECQQCGETFQPNKTDQKCCSSACSHQMSNDSRYTATPKDAQMEGLFRYYESGESIDVLDRPDGSRVLVMSDTQFPFVDEPLLEAVHTFAADYKANDIIFAGDILDCYEISDFDKRPHRLFGLDDEIDMAVSMVDRLKRDSAKGADVWWADGNHEARMQRVLWKKAAGFESMVATLADKMDLDNRVSGHVPYGKHINFLGFTVTHGQFVSQHSAYTAKKHYDKYHSSGMNGHTHRAGSYSHTDMHQRSHTWFEIGCLCRRDLDYVKGVANWQHAFLIGTVFNNALHPQLIRVIETDDGRGFFADGRYYPIYD